MLQIIIAPADINVGFVQKQDGIPTGGTTQNIGKSCFHADSRRSQLTGMNTVKRFADDFGIHFCRQGLAESGCAHTQNSRSSGLPFDNIVHQNIVMRGQDIDQCPVVPVEGPVSSAIRACTDILPDSGRAPIYSGAVPDETYTDSNGVESC